MPALYPDVSAIHVHESDIYGNCRARGITVSDFDVARASKRLIITCERLISNDEIRRDPSYTVIPYWWLTPYARSLTAVIPGICMRNISLTRSI